MFVARVVGKSIEPAIPDGSYCLFASPAEGSRQGKTVHIQLRHEIDPETGERYTVKRYQSQKVGAEEGGWRHKTVSLLPTTPEFAAIMLTPESEEDVRVIAELVAVLGRGRQSRAVVGC